MENFIINNLRVGDSVSFLDSTLGYILGINYKKKTILVCLLEDNGFVQVDEDSVFAGLKSARMLAWKKSHRIETGVGERLDDIGI